LEGHLVGVKTLDQFNPQSPQLVTHGRVNARVTSRDTMPCLAGQRGQAPHEGATNAQDMYMHARILGGHRAQPGLRPAEAGHNRCP
jgi:hypothetical protein